MLIQSLPIEETTGHLLLHNVADDAGQKLVKKGTRIGAREQTLLREAGYTSVDVAILDQTDVQEDEAAAELAAALRAGSPHLLATRAVGGRVNLHVEENGVLYVDSERLSALNRIPGVTLATRAQYSTLGPAFETQQAATLKIIPYAIPRTALSEALTLADKVLRLAPLPSRRVALLITADEAISVRLRKQFATPTDMRLRRLGSELTTIESVRQEECAIAEASESLLASHDALIVGGQTSIMDVQDTTPRALARIGATMSLHGAPVEPGNLLALAYRGEQWILCAPGCARSPELNVVDLVLPRLLAGEKLGDSEIAALGLGGLL